MDVIEKNREVMTYRLEKREEERQKQIENMNKQKEQNVAKNEGVEYFQYVFNDRKQQIIILLEESTNLKLNELPGHFNIINEKIQELQKYVSASTFFLTEFKIRNSQDILNTLKNQLQELESKLIPKKKFGFKNKNKIIHEIPTKTADIVDYKEKSDDGDLIKWDAITCGINSKQNETLTFTSERINKEDVTLHTLENCVVFIHGTPSTLHMSRLKNCTIFCGPVSTSIFADKCTDCKFVIACQQLRLHSSQNIDIYLHVTSRAILEDCSKIQITSYNYKYENIDNDFKAAGLDQHINNWMDVGDFNWLSNEPSPNWKIMDDTKIINNWSTYVK